MPLPALVLGSGITATGVVRTLARANVPVVSGSHLPENLRWSRYYHPLRGHPGYRHGEPLAAWLATVPLERAVLFPCSDALVRSAADLPEPLRSRFPACLPPASTLDRIVDKGPFAALLETAGIPHPWTRLVRVPADLDEVPAHVVGQGFLKPRNSQAFFGRFGVKAWRIASREEAVARLEAAQAHGLELLLQEYIPGPPSAHLFVDGYIDRAGQIRALFVRRRLRMYPPDFGNSSYMVSIAPHDAPHVDRVVRDLLAALDYRGIFSVELKQDPRDALPKVIELNARPWWYVEFAARAGVNVLDLHYREAQGQPLLSMTTYQTGRTLMYPPYDWPARRAAGVPVLQWLGQLVRADQPLFRWIDPMPGVQELAEAAWSAVRRRVGLAG